MQTLQLENQATKLNFVFYNIIKVATPLPQKDSNKTGQKCKGAQFLLKNNRRYQKDQAGMGKKKLR